MIIGYHYDPSNGFYDGERVIQLINGKPNYPKNVLPNAPALKAGFWYKAVNGEWQEIAIPQTCAEAIAADLHAVSNSPDPHDREVVALLTALAEAEKDTYRTTTDKETLVTRLEVIPPKTLEEVKAEKMEQLEAAAGAFENNLNKDMYFKSSLGFLVNGDRRTRSNLEDLIAFSPSFPVAYRDYENTARQVEKAELQIMLQEHITNGQNLYQQKWAMQAAINAAATVEEVAAIEIKFIMMDFSNEP